MKKDIEIYEEGLEEYPKSSAIVGNFVLILWVAFGTIACRPFYAFIAWIYLALAVAMVGIILRKLVCTDCYYYDKCCCMAWGRLSAQFLRRGDIEKFSDALGKNWHHLLTDS